MGWPWSCWRQRMRLVKASEMQKMDSLTIQKLGIPGIVLMENAARGVAGIFLDHFNPHDHSHVVLVCGSGNNGGDGYVVARYLHEKGIKTTVLVLSPVKKIKGDALTNLDIIRKMKLDVLEIPGKNEWSKCRLLIENCDYIIDGLLGTGLNSSVKGFFAQVIEDINASPSPVTAIDIPSGLNADTGQIMGKAVQANLTVTFGFPKIGQFLFPGAALVGRLVNVDIGIPEIISNRVPGDYNLIEPTHFSPLLPFEREDIHKGERGHLLILAGSTGKTGAASLTALGALRAGAGLVTLGIPASLNAILENKLTEPMTCPLPETADGSLSLKAETDIVELMDGKTAIAIGPGLSTHEETTELVRQIVSRCPLPMVIDADGLNALSEDLGVLSKCRGQVILTPHPGEMARLAGIKTAAVQADRLGTATRFVKKHNCFLVLKGARTLIMEPEGRLYVNPTGNPALSGGGSGDVLTGMIAGLVTRGWPLGKSALGGVYLHGMAADLLTEDMGPNILAGELLDVIPELTSALVRNEWPLEAPPIHKDLYHPL